MSNASRNTLKREWVSPINRPFVEFTIATRDRPTAAISDTATDASMRPMFQVGQVLEERESTYPIAKELYRAVDEAAVYLARSPGFEITVLKRMYHALGPFPSSIADIVDPETFEVVHCLDKQGPPQRVLQRWTTKEVPSADNEFVRRILRLDPRDRPTAEELLGGEWLTEQSEDTRVSVHAEGSLTVQPTVV